MTQRQIHKRQHLYYPENSSQGLDPGPHFPMNKVMALPMSEKEPGSPSPPPLTSPPGTGYYVRPNPYLSHHVEPQVVVPGKIVVSPLVTNSPYTIHTKSRTVIPSGFHSAPRYSAHVRRRKQIIGDSVFFVKPGEELMRGKPGRSRRGSGTSDLSHMTGRSAEDSHSITSRISHVTLGKNANLRKEGDKRAKGQANQFWASVEEDSVFEHSGHSSGDRDSLVRQPPPPPTAGEGRAVSTGGLTHHTQAPHQVTRLASSSRTATTVRPSTVSASSFTSRRAQSILDHDYYYGQSPASPQYYTVGRNSERVAVNRVHREAMDYSATSLPRGITIYRPSSEVALYPQVSYYQPVHYDTYSRASSTMLVKSKVLSTSMPHLHKAGLELSKADKKVLKKLQKEEKKREKEEKKRQKEALRRKKKKGEPIYDVPIRVHNTVPRNFHQTTEAVHRSPGLVYVPMGARDPATRPPLAIPPPPPSHSDLVKVHYETSSVSPKLENKVFHTSAPDLLRVEQVYGRTEMSLPPQPAPTSQALSSPQRSVSDSVE